MCCYFVNLFQVAKDLEDADQKRKQMFKEYEMQKHFEREQKLKQMTDEERDKFLSEENKLESEREVKHKVDPVCITNVYFS